MKLIDLLKLPMMEDDTLEGVLDMTGLIDVDVDYMCNALGLEPSISLEDKRDYIVSIVKKASTFNPSFDANTYKLLCELGNHYNPTDDNEEKDDITEIIR